MHEVLFNRLGGLSLPRKSVVRLTDRPDMTLDVYRGRKKNKNNNLVTILPGRQPKDYRYTVFYERATLDFLFASLAGRRSSSEKWEATLKKAFAPGGEVLSIKS